MLIAGLPAPTMMVSLPGRSFSKEAGQEEAAVKTRSPKGISKRGVAAVDIMS